MMRESSWNACVEELLEKDFPVETHTRASDMTTTQVGAPFKGLVQCWDAQGVSEVVSIARNYEVPLVVVGGGSNIIAADESMDVPVLEYLALHPVTTSPAPVESITVEGETASTVIVRATAGVCWDDFVRYTVSRGWGGVECLSGIPGQVGATPVQNVGAYGVEVESCLRRVELVDRHTAETRWEPASSLDLAYRTSNLKGTDRAIVTTVEFGLHKDGLSAPILYSELARRLDVQQGERVPVERARELVLELRRSKGMVLEENNRDTYSSGSFFTNPIVDLITLNHVVKQMEKRGEDPAMLPHFPVAVPPHAVMDEDTSDGSDGSANNDNSGEYYKLSAAWLIDHAGFTKGFPGQKEGHQATLSTRHTLAMTNRGAATTQDIVELATQVRNGVWEKYGVELVPEPVFLGCSLPALPL